LYLHSIPFIHFSVAEILQKINRAAGIAVFKIFQSGRVEENCCSSFFLSHHVITSHAQHRQTHPRKNQPNSRPMILTIFLLALKLFNEVQHSYNNGAELLPDQNHF